MNPNIRTTHQLCRTLYLLSNPEYLLFKGGIPLSKILPLWPAWDECYKQSICRNRELYSWQ